MSAPSWDRWFDLKAQRKDAEADEEQRRLTKTITENILKTINGKLSEDDSREL